MMEINRRDEIYIFPKIEEKSLNRGVTVNRPWLYERLNEIGMVPCFSRSRTHANNVTRIIFVSAHHLVTSHALMKLSEAVTRKADRTENCRDNGWNTSVETTRNYKRSDRTSKFIRYYPLNF